MIQIRLDRETFFFLCWLAVSSPHSKLNSWADLFLFCFSARSFFFLCLNLLQYILLLELCAALYSSEKHTQVIVVLDSLFISYLSDFYFFFFSCFNFRFPFKACIQGRLVYTCARALRLLAFFSFCSIIHCVDRIYFTFI